MDFLKYMAQKEKPILTYENTKDFPKQWRTQLYNRHKPVWGVSKLSYEDYEKYLINKGEFIGRSYGKGCIDNSFIDCSIDYYWCNLYFCYVKKINNKIIQAGCGIGFELQ